MKDKGKLRKIAFQRVDKLFHLARSVFREEPALAKRYVALARKIAMKYKLKLPSAVKKQFCKYCGSYWMPGASVRVRTQRGKVVYFCISCKKFSRFGYQKEKASKRAR